MIKSFSSLERPQSSASSVATVEDDIETMELPPSLQWLSRARAHPGGVVSEEDSESLHESVPEIPNCGAAHGFVPEIPNCGSAHGFVPDNHFGGTGRGFSRGESRSTTPESISAMDPEPYAPSHEPPQAPSRASASGGKRPFLPRPRHGATRAKAPTAKSKPWSWRSRGDAGHISRDASPRGR